MSFRDVGPTRGGSGGLNNNSNHRSSSVSIAVEYEDSAAPSHHVPMKKNGSASTASMSAGSSSAAMADEDPIHGGGSGRRQQGSTGSSSLDATVASLSSNITRYQKMVADYDKLVQTNNRSFSHERKAKLLIDGANDLGNEVARQLDSLEGAIGERRGPFEEEELARAKVSHSKLTRDFQRIRKPYDALVKRKSGNSGRMNGNGTGGNNLWSRDESLFGSIPRNSELAQVVMQREEEYSMQVMQSRENDIQQINQKMNKVNEIYKDLGNLVGEQQDQIDQLEDTAEESNNNAAQGLDQLERANRPWFGGKDVEKQQGTEAGTDRSWSDSMMDSMRGIQNDMEEIGNDVAAKGKAGLLAAQVMLCGAFGGAPYSYPEPSSSGDA